MTSHQPVFESSASYYDLSSKKWKTGTFTLTDKDIQFCFNESDSINNIPLYAVSGLEKKQSSFIYAAIVVSVLSDKHWFASFYNRDSVYNLIELFWREALILREHKPTSPQPRTGSTNFGKDLLNLLHESETTLVNAANSLSDQGRQIEETQATVEDINTDLNVAEKFIKNMSLTQTLFQLVNGSKILDQREPQKCFKVSFSFSESLNENCVWKTGMLFVSENILLVDEDRVDKLSVKYDEITFLEVLSSWKICLKYSVDGTEKMCYIMCPKLEKLLKLLNSFSLVNGKIFYKEDKSFASNTLLNSSTGPSTSSSLPESVLSPPKSFVLNNEQVQETMISDEDVQEISNMLNNLQDLASEISREQKSQMEKIESLMSNVERTELRIKADSKKIKKLT